MSRAGITRGITLMRPKAYLRRRLFFLGPFFGKWDGHESSVENMYEFYDYVRFCDTFNEIVHEYTMPRPANSFLETQILDEACDAFERSTGIYKAKPSSHAHSVRRRCNRI